MIWVMKLGLFLSLFTSRNRYKFYSGKMLTAPLLAGIIFPL